VRVGFDQGKREERLRSVVLAVRRTRSIRSCRTPVFPVTLKGSRITLRELCEDDHDSVQQYAGDSEVVKYDLWGPNTPEQSREFIRFAMSVQRMSPRLTYELAIQLNANSQLIGACGIRIRDAVHRAGDIGYTMRRDQWGMGLGTEVARTLIQFGFVELSLHRIWATCHVENVASARVLEKAGMVREGLLRKNKLQRGVWRDSYIYAILETDLRQET
jgi:ribosomal-protein-alanine N-acetyltransferase